MSQNNRFNVNSPSPVPGVTVPLAARVVPSVYSSVPTAQPTSYPNVQNPLRMLNHPQCIPQPVYPNLSIHNRAPFLAAVPPTVPSVYAAVPSFPGINPNVPNPAKLLEEKRKFEKERNFQMQQERLKQFPVGGKKANVSADRLIDTMLGQLQSQKPIKPSAVPSQKHNAMPWNSLGSTAELYGMETVPPVNKLNAFEKNVDWKKEPAIASKSYIPSWCQKNHAPPLYKQVEALVTSNNQHPPDTNLLFPILLSSGLSRESLGQLWELVNESGSGVLTIEELYAMLALIALSQSGYAVTSLNVLHQIATCPVPVLNHPPVVPSEPSMTSSSNIFNIDSTKTPEDDFDDFKCATPTAVNYALNTPTSSEPALDDDFDDFKQAPFIPKPESNQTSSATESKPEKVSQPDDLMSPEEDKYSAFRVLQQKDESDEWGGFTFATAAESAFSVASRPESCSQPVPADENLEASASPVLKTEATKDDDEFGDFMQANTPSSKTADGPSPGFADFSCFKQAQPPHLTLSSHTDDEFGEFTSCTAVPQKTDFGSELMFHPLKDNVSGSELMFHHLKDNVSLAESQSVSSLELGTFDGGGHSGDSKSSLSRQGSIPSLDLKSVGGIDCVDPEECSTDLHLSPLGCRNTKSPSPSSNTKGSDESESFTSPGLSFQPAFSLIDKYSVIRQEKDKEEDFHVKCWIRCLESCNDVLQRTKKIFNHMSCSSVCNEVLSSEEGGNYIKNVTEIYKVVCRVRLSSKYFSKQTQPIRDLLNEAEALWNTICGFFAGSPLMPVDDALDFSGCILKPEPENNTKACGLCLLNINSHQKQGTCSSLSYGGKNYHSPCANFWVNCVDPLLPALSFPHLL